MNIQAPRHTPAPLEPAGPVAPPVSAREWAASLRLVFDCRAGRCRLLHSLHEGPLRVQRPFYPEGAGCPHVYLLHPPGGLVLGDRLVIEGHLQAKAAVLITTPSAGKLYSVGHSHTEQSQLVHWRLEDGACLEWLPQETIVFDGAKGRLTTRVELSGAARCCLWDIVALGRKASAQPFLQGSCQQTLEIRHEGRLLFVEQNRWSGGADIMTADWGMRGCHVSGTFLAFLGDACLNLDDGGRILDFLQASSRQDIAGHWSLTQKGGLLIVRYLGDSAAQCRTGFERVWQILRPLLNNKAAVAPRIWNT